MPEKGEKSIGELFSELTRELRMLFRQEMDLFVAEAKEKLVTIVKDTAAIGLGLALLYFGSFVLLAALVLGLASFMPAWGAALLVAAALIGSGIALVLMGRVGLKHMQKKPEQTIVTLKETAQWAKTLRPSTNPQRTRFGSKSGIRKAT